MLMMQPLGRATITGLVAILVFWATWMLDRHALLDLRAAAATRPNTMLLAGREMPSRLFVASPGTTEASLVRLLVVVSDSCQACRNSEPAFRLLFGQLSGRADVTVVSLSGLDVAVALMNAAMSKGHHASTLTVADPTVFSTETGIRAVPTTVLVGSRNEALAAARDLTPEAITVFAELSAEAPFRVPAAIGAAETSRR